MASAIRKVPYIVHDVLTGKSYTAFVTPREAELYDIDKERRFRLLKQLKEVETVPTGQWDKSMNDTSLMSSEISVWEPPGSKGRGRNPARKGPQAASSPLLGTNPVRATGKTGAEWSDRNTREMLTVSLKHVAEIRSPKKRYVDFLVWIDISDILYNEYEPPIDYSPEQIREKIRGLKRSFKECKDGLHDGRNWKFFEAMSLLFDEPLVESCQAPQEINKDMNSLTLMPHKEPYKDSFSEVNAVDPAGAINDMTYTVTHLRSLNSENKENVSGSQLDQNMNNVTEEPGEGLNEEFFTILQRENVISNAGAPEPKQNNETLPVTPELDQDFLRSPSKKNLLIGRCRVTPKGRSPSKTPRRKIAQCHLMWPSNVTSDFLEDCLDVKDELQRSHVQLGVWKDLAKKLAERGHSNISWEICREKFEYLKTWFNGTLLKVDGMIGGVKWPHFDAFKAILDVSSEKQGSKIWDSDRNVHMLLDLYKEKKDLMENSSAVRNTILYDEIALSLNLFYIEVDGKECQNQMNRLKDKFKREFDAGAKTGGACSKWPFYEKMYDMFKDSPTLNPLYAYSVGTTTKYTMQGNAVATEANRSTRTRPPMASSQSRGGNRRTVNRSVGQSMQHELAEELRLWRESAEKKSEERNLILKALLQKNGVSLD